MMCPLRDDMVNREKEMVNITRWTIVKNGLLTRIYLEVPVRELIVANAKKKLLSIQYLHLFYFEYRFLNTLAREYREYF